MSGPCRIGIHIGDNYDWFWLEVLRGIEEAAQKTHVELVNLDHITTELPTLPGEELLDWLERRSSWDFATLICMSTTSPSWYRILNRGMHLVSLTETELAHPYLIAPTGLRDITHDAASSLFAKMGGRGNVLLVGGLMDIGEAGRSRIAGVHSAREHFPDIHLSHTPSLWGYGQAYARAYSALLRHGTPIDMIIGLTDLVALAARDAAAALNMLHEHTQILGLGGSPLALDTLAHHQMTATVALYPYQFGQRALQLATQAARGQLSSPFFRYQGQLLQKTAQPFTSSDLADLSLSSLTSSALSQQHRKQRHLSKQEVYQVINGLTSAGLQRHMFIYGLTSLLRAIYHYDHVQLFRWLPDEGCFVLEPTREQADRVLQIPVSEDGVLTRTLYAKAAVFIQDMWNNDLFAPDQCCPEARTRIIVPVMFSDRVLALLDLHYHTVQKYTAQHFQRIEAVIDRIGMSLHSAILYYEAIDARIRAEQASQLKTRLLANVSHELRTPLNVILNATEDALHTTNSSEAQEKQPPILYQDHLHHITQNAQHLVRLIDDLLDLSSAEAGALTIVRETIQTRQFLQDIFSSFASQKKSGDGVLWELHLPPYLPVIEADPARLRQILLNLLDNARKFTSRGAIILSAEVVPPNLLLRVQDSGCGISSEQQKHIFEPFVSGLDAQRRPSGIGLGLAITRRLVALHDGQLTLESIPGHGSTFTIHLPLPQPDSQPLFWSSVSSGPTLAPGITNVLLKPVARERFTEMIEALAPPQSIGTILIVEDDAQIRDYYHRLAAQSFPHHSIQCVNGGTAALQLLRELTPQLVVLDLIMPDKDGFEVLKQIRIDPRTHNVPVLVMSGRTLTHEDVERLDHAHVIFQSKALLSSTETGSLFQHAFAGTGLLPSTSVLIKRFIAYVQAHYANALSRQQIAQALGVSERHLTRIVQRELDISPWEYLKRYRIKQAKSLLATNDTNISAIASQVGFDDPAYFSRVFRQLTGSSPGAYRRMNDDLRPPVG